MVTHLVEAGVHEAVEQTKLVPISRPKIQLPDSSLSEGKSFEFQAEFDVEPEIELRQYKKVPVKKNNLDVTEEEVNQTIDNIRERMASLEPLEVEKPVKGCFGVVEVGFDVIGETKEAEAKKTFTVELGAGKLLPELEKALMEMAVGEQRQINAKFPDEYDDKKLAGKDATFDCKVLELKKKVLPEVNDTFAAQLKPNGTLEDLKKEIRESLANSKNQEGRKAQRNEIMEYLIASHQIEVPQSMLDNQIQGILRYMHEDLKRRGQSLEALKKEEMELIKKQAEQMVKSSLLLKEIAVKEKIALDEAKYQERLKGIFDAVEQEPGRDRKNSLRKRDARTHPR